MPAAENYVGGTASSLIAAFGMCGSARRTRGQSLAQVGLWLAAAYDPQADALAMAFKGIDPKEEYPWMGKKLSAQEIRERLQNPPAPAPVTLKELQHKVLVIPDSVSWMYGLPAVYPEGLAVAGPSSLAWYDGSGVKPAWSKLADLAPANKLWQPLHSAARAAVRRGGQSVCSLGSSHATYQHAGAAELLLDLAAFDVAARANSYGPRSRSRSGWTIFAP